MPDIQITDLNVPIAFDAGGNLYVEQPVGSHLLKAITSSQVTLPADASMQAAVAFGKGFLAFTDLKHSKGAPAVYNPALGKLDPLSMRPVGDFWEGDTQYQLGEVVCPSGPIGGNGHLYQCTTAGISGPAQPIFPTGSGATVADGSGALVWTEVTPVMALSAQLGTITYGLRYMVVLFVNRNGYISGMTQNGVVQANIPAPSNTTAKYTATSVSIVGGVNYYRWPTGGTGTKMYAGNPNDANWVANGGGTFPYLPLTLAGAGETASGNSLIFDLGGSNDKLPVAWAIFDDAGNITGTTPLFPSANQYNFYDAALATLWVPAAGSYTFAFTHADGAIWGIGGDGASWPGKGTLQEGVIGNTITIGGGYPVLPSTQVITSGAVTDTVVVTFDAPGLFQIEVDRIYHDDAWRTMVVTCMADGSTIPLNITPTSLQTVTSNTTEYALGVTKIPLGPPNTIARILAFTPAGQLDQIAGNGISNAGPYFWIAPANQYFKNTFDLSLVPSGVTVADVVNGVVMNSTLINDNTTTEATLNFTDDYLKATLNDVSSFFNKIQVPPLSDLYYVKSLQRMFYKPDNLPSGWLVSLAGDPESVLDTTGIVQCAENNGENAITLREFKGIVYLLKERSGHVLNPDTINPSDWRPKEEWTGSGPCGPRAADVCTRFMIYVHRSGVWHFDGGTPNRISKEIPITWKNINWAAAETIWVMIDEESHEVNIGVPTGKSTVPDKLLVCNFEESPDFEPPIHFSPYIGKEIAAGACYKWSISDIEANTAIRAERPLQNPPDWMDAATTQSQVLFASSAGPNVDAVIPGVYNDNGEGIDWTVETSAHENPIDPPGVSALKPSQLGGVSANIDGQGQIWIDVLCLRAPTNKKLIPANMKTRAGDPQIIPIKKPVIAGVPFSSGARGQNERFRTRISNHKAPDVWGSIKWVGLFLRALSTGRPGK